MVPSGDPCLAAGTCGNVYDCWDHASGVVALTTSTFITATGELVDADVELNAATAFPTIVDSPPCSPSALSTTCVANDVQNAATHEFGHFLGLDHSPDPSSTMYANEPIGETSKRVLDSGSKQFVCDVYPQGGASQGLLGELGDREHVVLRLQQHPGAPADSPPGLALLLAAFAGAPASRRLSRIREAPSHPRTARHPPGP